MTSRVPAIWLSAMIIALIVLASCSSAPKEPVEIRTRLRQADSLMEQGHARSDELAYASARSSYRAALDLYASLDDRSGTVYALLALGRTERRMGDDASAADFYFHAASLAEASGDPRLRQDAANHLAELALRRGDPVGAADMLATSLFAGGREEAARLRILGSARYAMGEEETAVDLLTRSAEIAVTAEEKTEAAQAWYKLASIASLGARFDEAAVWALKALEADSEVEYGPGIAADLRALAIISDRSGDEAAAADYYLRSYLAWMGLGRDEDAAEARMELEKLLGRSITIP